MSYSILWLVLLSCSGLSTSQPNIIFMLVDDLGWADVGFHNPFAITPNIDNLAQEGLLLNQSYVHPMCTPTRTAILSSKYPFNVGLQEHVIDRSEMKCLDTSLPLLPEALKEVGYTTHMAGKWHLGHCNSACTPTSRGFDTATGSYTGFTDHYTKIASETYNGTRMSGTDYHLNDVGYNMTWHEHSTDVYSESVVQTILEHDQASPLFVWLAFQAPHTPRQAPDEYLELYEDIEDEDRRTHLAMVSHIDDGVKRVMDALHQAGMQDNTLVIWMSDNGGITTGGYNYPLRGRKNSVWEGGVRSPTIVWGNILQGNTGIHDGLFHATDWYPTLLKIAGGQTDNWPYDGVDNSDMITEGGDSNREEMVYHINEVRDPFQGAIRIEEYKFIIGDPGAGDSWVPPPEYENVTDSGYSSLTLTSDLEYNFHFPEEWDRQLYNIKNDPEERQNIIADYPEVAEILEARLREYTDNITPAIHGNYTLDADPDVNGGYWTHGWCDV